MQHYNSEYRSIDSTPITTRQLESMIRLAEARARAELREEVTADDARDVVEIMKMSLWDTYEDEIGAVDFLRSQNGKKKVITNTIRSISDKFVHIGSGTSKKGESKQLVGELQRIAYQSSNNVFTYDSIYQTAKSIGLKVDKFNDMIETLNIQGKLQF